MPVQTSNSRAPGHGPVSVRRRASAKRDDRQELIALLMERKVASKNEIMRVKALIRELADRADVTHPRPDEAQDFIAAYLDLYLARISGDAVHERAGLRKCLSYIGSTSAAA